MRIGTRDSRLAMRQTEIFAERLKAFRPDVRYEVVGMKAAGDLDLASPLNGMEGTGAFVRELDDALLRGDIDLSVNSLKDIPVMPSEGISVGAVLPRDAPEDVMLPCSPEARGSPVSRRRRNVRQVSAMLTPVVTPLTSFCTHFSRGARRSRDRTRGQSTSPHPGRRCWSARPSLSCRWQVVT